MDSIDFLSLNRQGFVSDWAKCYPEDAERLAKRAVEPVRHRDDLSISRILSLLRAPGLVAFDVDRTLSSQPELDGEYTVRPGVGDLMIALRAAGCSLALWSANGYWRAQQTGALIIEQAGVDLGLSFHDKPGAAYSQNYDYDDAFWDEHQDVQMHKYGVWRWGLQSAIDVLGEQPVLTVDDNWDEELAGVPFVRARSFMGLEVPSWRIDERECGAYAGHLARKASTWDPHAAVRR